MRRYGLLVTAFLFCQFLMSPVIRAGTVMGTIKLERARVVTEGAKSFRDVVISLEPVEKQAFTAPSKHIEMDQKGLVFIPHVMAVQMGTPVDFLNSDNDRHNVYFLFESTGETLDIGTWGPGQTVTHTFTETGEVITLCQLHLEMAAYILIFDHPYFTIAEIDSDSQTASFQIDGVPPGDYVLKAWHKKLKMKGESRPISVGSDPLTADLVITKKKYAN